MWVVFTSSSPSLGRVGPSPSMQSTLRARLFYPSRSCPSPPEAPRPPHPQPPHQPRVGCKRAPPPRLALCPFLARLPYPMDRFQRPLPVLAVRQFRAQRRSTSPHTPRPPLLLLRQRAAPLSTERPLQQSPPHHLPPRHRQQRLHQPRGGITSPSPLVCCRRGFPRRAGKTVSYPSLSLTILTFLSSSLVHHNTLP